MSNAISTKNISDEALVEDFLEYGKTENPVALSYPINIWGTEHKYELEMSVPGF